MGDSEYYRDLKESQKIVKAERLERNMKKLDDLDIVYHFMNESIGYVRIDDWDFWASTGKFMNIKTRQRGVGLKNLLKRIKQNNNFTKKC